MEQYLGLITSHSYTSNPNSVMSTSLRVWQTENAALSSSWCTTWYSSGGQCEGLTWASKIATGLYSANLSAYLYWQGAEVNQVTSSFLVLSDGTTVTPSGRLWAFAHWSRFVRPGARRVSTTGTIGSVQIGAFLNTDNSVIVVFTNSGSSAQSAAVSFAGFTPSVAVAYLTDNSGTMAATSATLSGGVVTVSMTAYSALTVKLTGSLGGGSSGTTSSSTTVSTTSTTSKVSSTTTTTSATGTATCTAAHWGQCAGNGWTGCTVCVSGTTCTYQNDWYSQCL
jgi:O-glycosyl hydrolase